MSPLIRIPLCAFVGVVLFSTTAFLLAKLGGQRMEENLDLLHHASRIGEEMHRHEALVARSTPIIRRNHEKHRLVQELIAHRLKLRAVLQEFRELNQAVIEAAPEEEFQPPLDETSLRQNLLTWLQKEAADQPSVKAELERELAGLPSVLD
jgi:hypothetical protein